MTIWFVFTVLLSLIVTLGRQIVFVGSVWGKPHENYVMSLSTQTIVNFIVAFIAIGIISLLLLGINSLYQIKILPLHSELTGNKKEIFLFCGTCFIVIFLAWLPYILTYLPGGVFADTFNIISQAYVMDESGLKALNNHHPILYTLMWRGCILFCRNFGLDLYNTIEVFLFGQCILMISVMTYLLWWLRKNGLHLSIVIILFLFISFFPLFPLYAISLWKDTIFSLFLLLFSLTLGEYAFCDKDKLLNNSTFLIKLVIAGLLVCFLRNNGKYIVFASFLVILLMNITNMKNIKKFFIVVISMVIFVQGVQGPVFNYINYNQDTTVESLGVPLQQIAYLVYYNYDLSEEELEYIDKICPIHAIKENYNPCLFDALKGFTPEFNIKTIKDDKIFFFKNYLKMILKHPIGATKGFMLATAGFWAPNIASFDGYIQNYVWENDYGIEDDDYIQSRFGFTIKNFIESMKSISSAVFLFCMFFAAFVAIFYKRYKLLLLLLPAFINWVTIIIATPLASSLRYVYILVLIIPINVFILCMAKPLKKSKGYSNYLVPASKNLKTEIVNMITDSGCILT